ncbi:MAG: hypothetical protein KatS3mg101_0385 [Patescibacteria group bacterium]|nr:MAG: hypothetical protein KatS3mg101_0385 [Patescibacteria group bacterium]
MSLGSKLLLFLLFSVLLAILVHTQKDNIKPVLDSVLLKQTNQATSPETPIPGSNTTEGSFINNVTFEKCTIIITDNKGNRKKIGEMHTPADKKQTCLTDTKFIVSDSRKYLMFEDVSNGQDLELRIYSIDKNKLDSFYTWKNVRILDMEFLQNDKVLIFIGQPELPDEQQLSLYNIPALYADYENNVDKYGNLWSHKFETKLPITPSSGNYIDIVEIGKKVSIFGGTINKPVLRAEFNISDL